MQRIKQILLAYFALGLYSGCAIETYCFLSGDLGLRASFSTANTRCFRYLTREKCGLGDLGIFGLLHQQKE
ncbi:G protein-coupled receptor [Sarotherodon galilaeus]